MMEMESMRVGYEDWIYGNEVDCLWGNNSSQNQYFFLVGPLYTKSDSDTERPQNMVTGGVF